MKKLAIIGAGGHAKVVADAAFCSGWGHIEFFDKGDLDKSTYLTCPLRKIGELSSCLADFNGLVVAIGNNQTRLSWCQKILSWQAPLVSIVHPKATVSAYAEIGQGSVVFAGAVVNAAAKTGIGCIINTLASVDHDSILGDAVHISPGAHLSGKVFVGDLSWIGVGASVKECIQIGSEVIVGAGAAVVRDIKSKQTVVGVPAAAREKNPLSC